MPQTNSFATTGSAPARYAVAVALGIGALIVGLLIRPTDARDAFLAFYPAALLAFYFCGAGPGRLNVVLCVLAGHYFFASPVRSSWPWNQDGTLTALAFTGFTLLTGQFVEQLQASSAKLRIATDSLQATLSELKVSEQRHRAMLEDQTDVISRFRHDGTVLYVNASLCRMFGVSRADLIGSTWQPAVHPQDLPLVMEKIKALSPANPVVTLENRVFGAQGQLLWAQFVNHAFFNDDGQLLEVQAVGRDITERKNLEAQLADSMATVQDLYDHAPCGYYSLDSNGKYLRINAVALAWLGCTKQEVIDLLGPEDFLSEEGRDLFRSSFPQFMADGYADNLEFDLLGRQGQIRRVSVSATALRDGDGRFLMSRSVMHDITELHRVRSQLQRLAQEQDAMLHNEPIGIVKLRDRIAIWTNSALERILGYEPGELIGLPSRQFYLHDEAYLAMGEAAYPVLKAGGNYRIQIQMVRKNGEPIWADLSGVMLSEEKGESMWLLLDITAMKQYQRQIEHFAFHDALTGLPNRMLLADRLNQALHLAERNHQMLAVCYLDLDGFKPVNDQFGHAAGDRLLKKVAQRLQSSVRANDTVARLGGDEFVLLLASLEQVEETQAILDRVIATLRNPFELDAQTQARISASIGVAFYPRNGTQPSALLKAADAAMYEAKKAGRNQIAYVSAGL